MPGAEGSLTWSALSSATDLVAPNVAAAAAGVPTARVAPIEATLADTAAFCAAYDVPLESSANCVVVLGRRGERTTYAAVLVLATDRADINGVVRRHLEVRKISFAPMDDACALTGMEYGGITPVGLPSDWEVLIDQAVVAAGPVVIGAGVRGAKLLVEASELAAMPQARVLALALPR
ncbi:MAG: hypothetical protein IPI32_05310 [Austwickia sp.]|jgi:prolyl-tRNA editing enzyme YbaK/EbsC (Cys-tRNA(Pro) deacylase)|nr:hypothetical protein [Austwickia sp.]MBK8437049.1 hypothetical protein [Austwickia sp.]MBK9100674.1 hypothetical protein [Austwickia sp.]